MSNSVSEMFLYAVDVFISILYRKKKNICFRVQKDQRGDTVKYKGFLAIPIGDGCQITNQFQCFSLIQFHFKEGGVK